jgi:hypothetical protein
LPQLNSLGGLSASLFKRALATIYFPEGWKSLALDGTDGIDAATGGFEEDAGAVGGIFESELGPVSRQSGVAIDECRLGKTQEVRDGSDIIVRQEHMSGPSTAGSALLASEVHYLRE